MKKLSKDNINNIIFTAAMVLVGIGAIAGYNFTHRAKASDAVEYKVERRDIEQRVDLTGKVEAVVERDLSFAGSGLVKKVNVKEGQTVVKGQILATLDASDLSMQRAQAKAALKSDRLTADINLQKAADAQKTLLKVDKEKLAQARQAVTDAKNVFDNATDSLNGFSEPDNDAPTYASYLSIKQAKFSAEAAYNAAKQNLAVLQDSIKQAETAAQYDLNTAQIVQQLKQDTIPTGDISINSANLAYLDAVLAKTILRAPANGKVTLVDIEEGEYATPAKPVIKIESPDLQIVAFTSQIDVNKIKVGDKTEVTLDGSGGKKYSAKVEAVDTAETVVNGNSAYKVTLSFGDKDEQIKSGMTANVSITTDRHENAVAVPKQAVIKSNGTELVILGSGGKQEKKTVTTGLEGYDGYVEIVTGLDVGSTIISFNK